MRKRSITSALFIAPTLVAGVMAAVPANATPTTAGTAAIPNTAASWTAKTAATGTAAKTGSVTANVYLQPRGGEARVAQAATARATKGNPLYHKYLSTKAYYATYGTPTSTVNAVEAYLKGQGLTVSGVDVHNRYISVRGTVAAAQKAFGTTLKTYKHNGQNVQAPASNLSLPKSIAGSVLTVTGLDTTQVAYKSNAKYSTGFRNARPCSKLYGEQLATVQADNTTKLPKFNGKTIPYAVCGYTGPVLRSAYEPGVGNVDGSGSTIATVLWYNSPSIASDANTYAIRNGDGAWAPGQLTQVNLGTDRRTAACDKPGVYGEESLDIESMHAMAPGANVRYYGARSCYDDDLIAALQQTADDNVAKIVSNSWGNQGELGITAGSIAAYEQVFLQGANEGISYLFSSGDNGDEVQTTGIRQPDFPASDPYVTAVGGTATAIGFSGQIDFQTGWGTEKYSLAANGKTWKPVGYLYGAGGGTSTLFNKPSYQSGLQGGARQVPDIAMDADPTTGFLVGQTQAFSDGNYYDEYRIGGTSLASPMLAGFMALGLQRNGGNGFGLLNPAIYAMQGSRNFMDPTYDLSQLPDAGNVRIDYANGENANDGLLYSVRTFGQDASLTQQKGYDNVTGVGVPKPAFLRDLTAA